MFTNFKELEAYVLSHKNKKRIVLANAHDEPALSEPEIAWAWWMAPCWARRTRFWPCCRR